MKETSEINFSVKLEFEDYVSYNMAYMDFRMWWRRWLYVIICGVVLVNTLRQIWDKVDEHPLLLLLLLLPIGLFVLLWFAGKLLLRPRLRRIYESDSTLRNEHEYTFSREGIRLRSTTSDSKYFWQDIYEVRETRMYFFIFLGSNRSLIVPKAALDNDILIREFRELLRLCITDTKKIKLL